MGLISFRQSVANIHKPDPVIGRQTEYEVFREKVISELNPQGTLEKSLVEGVVQNLWRLKRAAEAEGAVLEEFETIDYNSRKIKWVALLQSDLLEKVQRFERNAVFAVERILKILREVR